MTEQVLIAIVGVIGALIGVIISNYVSSRHIPSEIKKTLAEAHAAEANARKAQVEADNAAIDFETERVNLLESLYEKRLKLAEDQIEILKKQVCELTVALHDEREDRAKEREESKQVIDMLNRQVGELQRGANTLRQRLDEVLAALRAAGGELPKWAQ